MATGFVKLRLEGTRYFEIKVVFCAEKYPRTELELLSEIAKRRKLIHCWNPNSVPVFAKRCRLCCKLNCDGSHRR